jgi:hypothetical protein
MSRRHPEREIVYIGAYHGISILSRLIKWFSWSDISHVAAIRADGRVIEAWGKGGAREMDSWHKGHKPGTRIDLYVVPSWSLTRHRKFWDALRRRVGTPYDWRGIFGFLTRRDGAANPLRVFCSGLLHAASAEVGSPFIRRVPSHRVAPGDIVSSALLDDVATVHVGAPDDDPDLSRLSEMPKYAREGVLGSGGVSTPAKRENVVLQKVCISLQSMWAPAPTGELS